MNAFRSYLRSTTAWLLLALVLTATITNIFWILADQSPPVWDIAAHSARAVDFGDLIRDFHPRLLFSYDTIYPPATYLVTGALFALLGHDEKIPQFSLLFYLIIYICSVFGISNQLFKHKWAALFATFLACLYPLVAHFSRIYDLDFPLTAAVALSLFALLKTERLTNLRWSIFFGLAIAFGLLTKWVFALFLIGPITAYLLTEKSQQLRSRRVLINCLLVVFIVLILAGSWYFQHFEAIRKSALAAPGNVFSVPDQNIFSWKSLSFYASMLYRGATWPLLASAIAGLALLAWRKQRPFWFLLSWLLGAYLLMTLLFLSKDTRYLLPVYPGLAIATAGLVAFLKKKWLSIGLALLMSVVALIFWFKTSWNINLVPAKAFRTLGFSDVYGLQKITTQKPYFGYSYPTNYQPVIKEISQAIKQDVSYSGKTNKSAIVIVIPNSIFLTAAQIQYYGNLIGLKADYSLSSFVRSPDFAQFLKRADYIVTKTGNQGPKIWAPYLPEIEKEAENPESEIFKNFEVIKTWRLDGIEKKPQEARLYRQKGCGCGRKSQ